MTKLRAFTLVELLVYMALLSVFLVVLSEIFLSVIDTQSESESLAVSQQDGRYILLRLVSDLSGATSITTPALGTSGSSLQATINTKTYLYSQSGNNLTLSINGAASDQLNSYNATVSGLVFTHLGNGTGQGDTVKIQFNIISQNQRSTGPETRNFTSTVGLRQN